MRAWWLRLPGPYPLAVNITVWYSCADFEGGRFAFAHLPREAVPRIRDIGSPRAWEPRSFTVIKRERGPNRFDVIVPLEEVRER